MDPRVAEGSRDINPAGHDIVRRALALAPPAPRELRIIRYRVRSSTGQAAGEWVGDAVFGSDAGPSDGARPLRVASVHWVDGAGATIAVEVGPGETVTPHDVARLMSEARRRGVMFAVWTETDHRPNGTMQLSETWFSGTTPDLPDVAVECRTTQDGMVVTVDERIAPQRWWLLMYVALLASFAWVFFLVIGGLPHMVRDIWRRAVTGIGQTTVFELDARSLRVEVTGGSSELDMSVDRGRLLALGSTFGLTAYLTDEAVPLAVSWASADAARSRAQTASVVACLNRALAAN